MKAGLNAGFATEAFGSPTQTVLRTGNLSFSSCRARPERQIWALECEHSDVLMCKISELTHHIHGRLTQKFHLKTVGLRVVIREEVMQIHDAILGK